MSADTEVTSSHPPGALSMLIARLARGPPVREDEAWAIPLRPGDRVGRYEIVRELARGGFGAVYEGVDGEIGRSVAVKTVRPGRALSAEGGAAWLHAEAEAVGSLSHPGIVNVHDVGVENGAPYVVMELLRGETLADRMARRRLSCLEAVRVARDVAVALAYAHGRGVLHRDLKPGNVFLCEDGATKLLDFGLSHVFGHGAGWLGGGTPPYLAPERWRREPEDVRGDLFSLGVLLHEMLTGRLPYPATERHSAALDPGPPPRLGERGVPRRVQQLVAAMLAKDPAGRPVGADLVSAELDLVVRRLERKRRTLWTARIGALAVAVAVATSGALWRGRDAAFAPTDRLPVSVADFANETGDPTLDGLSGLVITSLEQSRRLQVLTRSRMADLLRQLGREDAARIDEGLARQLAARAGARAVLVGSIRRFDELYTLELRGLDPRGDAYLFAVRSQARGKGSIPDAIDRLSGRAREALQERAEDVRASAVRVAEAVTPSLEAYDHYFRGVDCLQRPSRQSTDDARACAAELRRAVAIDPTFAMAWMQLAMIGWNEIAAPTADAGRAIAEALRYADRVPAKERALIRAWAAVLEDRTGDALAELDEVIRAFPTDKQALYVAGDLLWHREELRAAIPYLERVLALDPTFDFALDHLAFAHAVLGNREALVEWVPRWQSMPQTPAVNRAIVGGRLGLGDGPGAAAAARRGLALGPEQFGLHGLGFALSFTGAYPEPERELRAREGRLDFLSRMMLAHALAAQGKRAEARDVIDAVVEGSDEVDALDARLVRAVHLAGEADPAPLRAEAEALRAVDPLRAARLATHLARLGDLAAARTLAQDLEPATPTRELYEAVVAWKEGRIEEARGRLELLEREHPQPAFGIAPAFLRAELEAEDGRDDAALEALDRLDALPFQRYWRSWAYPQALLLRGRVLARTGRDDEARAALARLEALWARADPGLPLLDETREILSRLR